MTPPTLGRRTSGLEYPFEAPQFAELRPLADNIEWIRLPLPFPPGHVNVYRLAMPQDRLLVDAGYYDENTTRAWEAVGLPPAARVAVTHFHPDHIGQAARLESAGTRVFVPKAELAKARSLVALSDEEVNSAVRGYFAAHAVSASSGSGNGYRRAVPWLPGHAELLEEGQLAFATDWSVRFAGGHSPSHAVLISSASSVIAAGDILLPEISPNISVWPDNPDADPLGDFLASLESLQELASDTLVLPAHGLPYCGVRARIEELVAHHTERLDLVRHLATRQTVTAAYVMPRMFSTNLQRSDLLFALGETIAHLNRLWHAGEIERRRDGDGVYRYAS